MLQQGDPMTRTIKLATAALLLGVGLPAAAHHSFAIFEHSKTLTLKGTVQSSVDVEIEGGTIGTLTLRVSDQESITTGDRGVFYLSRSARGTLVPHLRGQGFLRLDRTDRVPNSSLTLEEIRRTVAAGRPQ